MTPPDAVDDALRKLARAKFPSDRREALEALSQLVGANGVEETDNLIERAIASLDDLSARAAAEVLVGAKAGAWETLSARREIAATEFGVSVHAFRRRHEPEVLGVLARSLTSRDSAEDEPRHFDGPPRREEWASDLGLPDLEQPLVLSRTTVEKTLSNGSTIELEGQVELALRPTPAIRIHYRSADTPLTAITSLFDSQRAVLSIAPSSRPTGLSSDDPPWTRSGYDYTGSERHGHLGTTGDLTDAAAVRVFVINLDRLTWTGPVELVTDDWRVRLNPPEAGLLERLREEGGFGISHLAEITASEASISALDLDEILDQLFHFLAFVNGRQAGLAVPTGIASNGEPVWCEWSVRVTDPHRSSMNWYDLSLASELPGLFNQWVSLWRSSELWKTVLRRATRIIASSNQPDPIDVALVTASSGLELLAWAVREAKEGPAATAGRSAAENARRLLEWGGIPCEIPLELAHLRAMAGQKSLDGPGAVTWVRNRIVHPPLTDIASWPSGEMMHDTWRLIMDYLELVVLRILGYEGEYAHRRHMEGRFPGATQPVPWMGPPASW